MIEPLFTMAKTVFLVAVLIPMMMGLTLSLVGFGALQWSRFVERRVVEKLRRAESGPVVEPVGLAQAPATADS